MSRSFFAHRCLIVVLAVLFCFACALPALAADLVLSPATGSYSTGQTFTATVRAVPGGDDINAVEATLSFDPAQLSVVSVSKTGSVFSLWTTEPAFSNSAGTVTFGGGSPTPFSATSNLVNITFRVAGDGDAAVSVSEASVLAADGRGTDVYEGSTGGSYTLAAATAPTPTPEPTTPTTPPPTEEPADNSDDEAIIFGDPPRPPEIGSQTFLDADVWYKQN